MLFDCLIGSCNPVVSVLTTEYEYRCARAKVLPASALLLLLHLLVPCECYCNPLLPLLLLAPPCFHPRRIHASDWPVARLTSSPALLASGSLRVVSLLTTAHAISLSLTRLSVILHSPQHTRSHYSPRNSPNTACNSSHSPLSMLPR